MNRKLLFRAFLGSLILVLLFVIYGIYTYYLTPLDRARMIHLVPEDAVFILETDDPIGAWRELSSSELWQHLRGNKTFAELTADANGLDTLVQSSWFDYLGKVRVMLSAHMYTHDNYDFLYLIDLDRASKFGGIKDYIGSLVGKGYLVTTREYSGYQITEMTEKATKFTLSMALIKNTLAISYQPKLLEAAINQYQNPTLGTDPNYTEVYQKTGENGLLRLYFQYQYLDDYAKAFSTTENEYVNDISKQLLFSGLDLDLDEKGLISAKGFTGVNDTISSYLRAMTQAGKGRTDITKVAPQRTAFYMGLGFDRFSKFMEYQEQTMQENDLEAYQAYTENIRKLENFLKIDIKENFYSWIDDEIAFIQIQPEGLGNDNEFAVVLKARSAQKAKSNLEFINRQIRRRTPVKFKTIAYKGHEISFLSVKGLFKVILGKFFSKLDKPHYTIIGNYVIFSNHPQTLKSIINDYDAKLTLSESFEFNDFRKNFDTESNLFLYINMPILHPKVRGLVDDATWYELKKNKNYLICFPKLGFQLTEYGDIFSSNLFIQYQSPEKVIANQEALAKARKSIKDGTMYLLNQITGQVEDTVLSNIAPLNVNEDDYVDIDEISPDNLDARSHTEKYPSGEIKLEVGMKDGQFHGFYREYFENGNIKVKGGFKQGKKHGKWIEYDLAGNRIRKTRYRDDEEI